MKPPTQHELDFMLAHLDLPDDLRKHLEIARNTQTHLTDEEKDDLRDLCGERLQTHGFDENYELTSEGKILEELIDILFIN